MPLSLTAQGKFQLTFEQSANYSIYNFNTTLPYSIPGRELKPRVGFESELRLYYTPKEKLSYYVGVGFNKYNYTSGKFRVRYSDQILPKPGFELPEPEKNPPSHVKLNYSYNYLSIPVGVQYAFNKRFVVSGGLKVLRFLSVYGYSKFYYPTNWTPESNYNRKTFDNQGYSPWVVNLEAEVGYTLPILKYDITWKVAFEYAITDYISNKCPDLNLYPYTFSLGASFPLVKF
ncbi:MAG TPA: outer membrane beta-barrel protein [Bacteroidia bacterium]|nr:outer membrane beta-barrel protein [Bacteroidia bacterium]